MRVSGPAWGMPSRQTHPMSETTGRGTGQSADQPPAIVSTAAQVVSAVLGASIGGVPGAAIGAASSDYILAVATETYRELSGRRRASVQRLIDQASREASEDAEVLVARALQDEAASQLLLDAVMAASETLLTWKVDSLGRALARGLTDDQARIDEERLIVLAISDLEPPHVKTLVIVSRARRALTRESIEGNVGLSDADIVIPVLLRHGLVRVPRLEGLTAGDPPPSWEITRFGQRVLQALGGDPGGMVAFLGGE